MLKVGFGEIGFTETVQQYDYITQELNGKSMTKPSLLWAPYT